MALALATATANLPTLTERLAGTAAVRGSYDEIVRFSRPFATDILAHEVLATFRPCLVEEYVDFDKKGRGDAVNHDLYAFDPGQNVAIVQARQASRRKANWYLEVHKTYFLVGFNELTGAPFRHPVSASVVRAAVRKHGSTDQGAIVRACQRWMWQVTPKQLATSVRQGDVLVTPIRSVPADAVPVPGIEATVDTHRVIGLAILRDVDQPTVLYVCNPTMTHDRGQHVDVFCEGWCRVALAREARVWNFSARMGD